MEAPPWRAPGGSRPPPCHRRPGDRLGTGPGAGRIAVLSALALGAAACSSVSASSTGDSVDDAKLIQVPDAFTSVVMRSLSAPTFPFLGTDGKYHVAYDLELTNASRVPATIDKLDVVSAAAPKRVIASYSGTQFVDPTCDYGDCNRLRRLPSAPADRQRHPAAGVPRPVRRLRVRLPRPRAQGGDAPPLRPGRHQPRELVAGADRLPGGALRHLGRHAAGDRPAGQG